jgi:hypothetical protein
MATVTARVVALAVTLSLAACDDLQGLEDMPTPLARIEVEVTGALEDVRVPEDAGEPASLHVALLWGNQWLPQPFCILPPESDEVEAVIAAGCRDPFSFAAERVGAVVPLEDGGAVIEMFDLPPADVMVGDIEARVAYGSVVVFDDRDGDGSLQLPRPERDDPDDPEDIDDFLEYVDRVYAASFVTMTQPDRRVAFREGGYDELAAFYPRSGCEPPPRGFSILDTGGFSRADALAAILRGELPPEDPDECAISALDETVIALELVPREELRDVACRVRGGDGTTRYREPPVESPDLETQTWACAGFPSFGGEEDVPGTQLVIATPEEHVCVGLTHYTLRGCDEDPDCGSPEWDRTESAPDWWPCD